VALILMSSSWSTPRFTLFIFPVIFLLDGLRRRPALWYAYLMVGICLQFSFLRLYVLAWPPAP
jgi:hypothetical protein